MIYVVRINNKEYEVEVEKGKANIIKTVEVSSAQKNNAFPIAAAHNVPSTPVVPAPDTSSEGTVVRAPMPGTVLEVKVTVGKRVQQGDVLLVFEAMKMENEVLASSGGIIKQVFVTKGASVATNDVMIIIE